MATVAKGVFVAAPQSQSRKRGKTDFYSDLRGQPWYRLYEEIRRRLDTELRKLIRDIRVKLIDDVVDFVLTRRFTGEFIPAVALFTGINLPDHENLFYALIGEIKSKTTGRVTLLRPARSNNAKFLIENLVSGFVCGENDRHRVAETSDENDGAAEFKKRRYTLSTLYEWYRGTIACRGGQENGDAPYLIAILPDIESFCVKTLRQFILALSVYKDRLPILLIFGVATNANAVNDSLPNDVLTELSLRVIRSRPSVVFLNTILEKVFLTSKCPFQLGSRVFEFLSRQFLYYNFSVEIFIRGLRFCLMNHFFGSDLSALCCSYREIPRVVDSLSENQKRALSRVPSFVKFCQKEGVAATEECLKTETIKRLLQELHDRLSAFHLAVRCLHAIAHSLPEKPLGNHIREIYVAAMTSDISKSSDFKTCFNLLRHLSKNESLSKIDKVIEILSEKEKCGVISEILSDVRRLRGVVEESNPLNASVDLRTSPSKKPSVKNRAEFMGTLEKNLSAEKIRTPFENAAIRLWTYLADAFLKKYLEPLSQIPLSEIVVYDCVDTLRACFEGTPRAVLHEAMVNPQRFLQCDCCVSRRPSEGITDSFPDLCVSYKRLLECGNEINVYDWLQTFLFSLERENTDSDRINPRSHARFLQTIKELQFLGYIAPSKKKRDHAKKLFSL